MMDIVYKEKLESMDYSATSHVIAAASEGTSNKANKHNTVVVCLFLLTILTLAGYRSVLFDWFSGDDLVHVYWLQKAIKDPSLVLHNFNHNWLDANGSLFYRPLVSVTIFADYLLWGQNGSGFHLTNILLHLGTSILLFAFALEMQEALKLPLNAATSRIAELQNYLFPFMAAAIFALHPVHPEVVSWMIGRVDSVAAFFSMLCLYTYARHSRTASKIDFVVALVAFALALCSKEMAVIVAPVIILYEIFILRQSKTSISIKNVVPIWLLLAAYFVVRQLSLGTWLGGYDNSLNMLVPLSAWITQLSGALTNVIVGANHEVVKSSNYWTKIWIDGNIICGASLILIFLSSAFSSRKESRLILFLLGFVVLSILPVYKIFCVMPDLEGARLAYFFTIPLSLLVGLAISRTPLPDRLPVNAKFAVYTICGSLMLCSAFNILTANNRPWRSAGITVNAIRKALKHQFQAGSQLKDKTIVLTGLPDMDRGAYVCRNAIETILEIDNLSLESSRFIRVLSNETAFPLGIIKELCNFSPEKLLVYNWSATKKDFELLSIERAPALQEIKHSAKELKAFLPSILEIPPQLATKLSWKGDKLVVHAGTEYLPISIDLGDVPCDSIDYLAVTCDQRDAPPDTPSHLYLAIPTGSDNIDMGGERVTSPEITGNTIVFPLCAVPYWAINKANAGEVHLVFPKGWQGSVSKIQILDSSKITPGIRHSNETTANKYLVESIHNSKVCRLDVDASKVSGAKGCAVEISPNLAFFKAGNAGKPEASSKMVYSENIENQFVLNATDFQNGIYDVRAWAVNAEGKLIGTASDHYRFCMVR